MARKKVFISYSEKDAEMAKRAAEKVRSGIPAAEVFVAGDNLQTGDEFRSVILNNLRQSNLFVVLFTHNAAQSSSVCAEIGAAVALNIPILPILEGCDESELPFLIRNIQFSKSYEWRIWRTSCAASSVFPRI